VLEAIFSWDTLWWIMMVLYVPCCLGLIVIVLMQKGKGVGFAGAFGMGGGGGDTVFGPRASRSLPIRLTHSMAAVFMVLALAMSMIGGKVGRGVAPEQVAPEESTAAFSPTDLEELGITEEAEPGVVAPAPEGETAPGTAAPGVTLESPDVDSPELDVNVETGGEAGAASEPGADVDVSIDTPDTSQNPPQ